MIEIKIVNKSNHLVPKYETTGSSGMDLRASITNAIKLSPFKRVLIPTGLFIELPLGYEAQIRARSGLSFKYGITVVNGIGTIDSDYRGEIKIPLINLGEEDYFIHNGDRIAQLVICKYERVIWNEVRELKDTSRDTGGFGSTGI